jgi:hypothetical protein
MTDGRQRKKVRFTNEGEGGSHHIGGRQVANIREVAKNKPRGILHPASV